jgi:hypothetical protein
MKGSRLGAFLLRCMGRLLKDSLVNQQFAQLPARGQSFAGGENGYAVFGVGEKRRARVDSTSGRVGLQCITGEAMAFDEHLIDFVNRLPAVAGRMARPER